MFYDGPPGMMLDDLVGPSPDGVDLEWIHPYSYAGSNPVNYVDPSGLYTIIGRVRQITLKAKFDAWYKLEKADVGWWGKLPNCPCTIEFD